MKKTPIRDIFISLPMSEDLRLSIGRLERDKDTQWDFLKLNGAGIKVLEALLSNKVVKTSLQYEKYKTLRLSNIFIGLTKILGAEAFNHITGDYQTYRLNFENKKTLALAKELRAKISEAIFEKSA